MPIKTRLYMVIERYRNGDPSPVYRRFCERGRMMPEGVSYIDSWVSEDLATCYQIMEAADRMLLEEWIANWSDIVDFEVHRVISSKEAAERVNSPK